LPKKKLISLQRHDCQAYFHTSNFATNPRDVLNIETHTILRNATNYRQNPPDVSYPQNHTQPHIKNVQCLKTYGKPQKKSNRQILLTKSAPVFYFYNLFLK
jgi:hypothetical protein